MRELIIKWILCYTNERATKVCAMTDAELFEFYNNTYSHYVLVDSYNKR